MKNYFAQHADPSSGCSQQAPLLSERLRLGVQQEELVTTWEFGSLIFCRTGISAICFSIFISFVSLI
jgi:hypothetical protein